MLLSVVIIELGCLSKGHISIAVLGTSALGFLGSALCILYLIQVGLDRVTAFDMEVNLLQALL